MGDELFKRSASDLAQLIRSRTVSCAEVISDALGRLVSVNPAINAIVDEFADAALTSANHADEKLRRGDAIGPLHGVPVTVKINVDQLGRATSHGVVAFKDVIAEHDSAVVRNWRRAGAIVIGRTNSPAFAQRWLTDNDLHGRTLNPWNEELTPGGSTGGGAAALIAGVGALAHGNDLAGSIRYPAYACGLFGLRPSFGTVPAFNSSATVESPMVVQQTGVEGVLSRSVRDLRLGLDSMSARDSRDPWWVPTPPLSQPSCGPVNVALFDTWDGCETDPAVKVALASAARWLQNAGYRISQVAPPRYRETVDIWLNLLGTVWRMGGLAMINKFGDEAVKRSKNASDANVREYDFQSFVEALALRTTLMREWNLFFDDYPLLLMPTSWREPFKIGADQQGDEAARQMLAAQSPLTSTAILGLPGVAVPTGVLNGIPTGVQLVCARYHERIALDAAEVIADQAPSVAVIEPRVS